MQSEQTIDIQRIMADIRQEIANRGLCNTVLPFDQVHATPFEAVTEYDEAQFSQIVLDMDQHKQILGYRPLRSRKIVGPIIIFFKRAIRKMSKFYIEPIVEDQNTFNATVVLGMQSIRAYMQRPEDQTAVWQAVRELRTENIALKKRVEQLEAQLEKAEG